MSRKMDRCVPTIGFCAENHAEIYFCIANKKGRNTVKNVESDTERYFDTDHYPLITTLRFNEN